uniref:EamA domain-containing protein n=1 Tax=Ditylum brightwellii TaxID=49249 RepID=A0A7S2E5E0_9STRA|mmetsp:Transcript_13606/g.20312  ORF Transcript_13606/g.20312 Transcript_13606/m.20312 type:complete len:663 (+) Transcript_13606:390-2378(+)
MKKPSSSYLLGLFFIVIVSIIWTVASVIVQHLYNDLDFDSPFVLVYIGTSLFSILLPFRLIWERRLQLWRYCGRLFGKGREGGDDDDEVIIIPWRHSLEQQQQQQQQQCNNDENDHFDEYHQNPETTLLQANTSPTMTSENTDNSLFLNPYNDTTTTTTNTRNQNKKQLLTHIDHFKIASIIAPLWFTSNYFYGLSLQYTSITSSTVLSSTGSLFTFLFATVSGDEIVTGLKVGGVAFTFGGSVLTGWNDAKKITSNDDGAAVTNNDDNVDVNEGMDRGSRRRNEAREKMNEMTQPFWKWIDRDEEEGEKYATAASHERISDTINLTTASMMYKKYGFNYGLGGDDYDFKDYSTLNKEWIKEDYYYKSPVSSSRQVASHRTSSSTRLSASSSLTKASMYEENLENISVGQKSMTRTGKSQHHLHDKEEEKERGKEPNKYHDYKSIFQQQQQQGRRRQQQQGKHKRKKQEQERQIWGDVAGLLSAVGYGMYTVVLRIKCPQDESLMSMSLLFGYVGVLNMVFLSPVFFHLVDFGVPSPTSAGVHLTTSTLLLIIGKGLFDNVLSDYLWARSVVLTSATVATVGLGLTIPMAFVCDIVLGHGEDVIQVESIFGAILVLVGFVLVNVGDVCGAPTRHVDDEIDDVDGDKEDHLEQQGMDKEDEWY